MKRHIRDKFFWVLFVNVVTVAAMMAQGAGPAMARTDPTPGKVQSDTGYGAIPLFFIPNQGQLDRRVAYATQGKDKSVFFTPEGLTFVLAEQVKASPARAKRSLHEIEPGEPGQQAPRKRWVVKLDFVGARRDVRPESLEKAETLVSYFKGRPEEWKAGLQTSSKVIYRDLWPGIDLVYSGTVNRLKYDFIVHPGADPAMIRLAYRGTGRVEVTGEGRLEVATPLGVFQDEIPVAWQETDGKRAGVAVAYALEAAPTVRVASLSLSANDATATPVIHPRDQGRVYGFTVGQYDPSRTLVLDPEMLIYCGYIGGSGNDYGRGIAVDNAGNAYVTGDTNSPPDTFPVAVGPDLTYNGGDTDAFVAKVNAAGTALLYCGYIGGLADDYGYGIAVDGAGNAYVTGWTESTEATFPVTVGPDLTFNGNRDAFVAKVNAAGTALLYCGYIGGSGYDLGRGIAVDGTGNAYVTGVTESTEATFPVTVGPDLTHSGDDVDAFVAKVNAAGTALLYCGYIGGSGPDVGHGIALDSAGNAYVTGDTDSTEATFPVAVGPDLTHNGTRDAFVAKVNAAGTALLYCGYIGGSGYDYGRGIAVDGAGNAYVTGWTESTEATFPVTVGPDLTHNGLEDAFVAKVSAAGTALVYCGYIGGSGYDYGSGIAVDGAGNAYVTGDTDSTEATFPVAIGPDLTFNGGRDAFVAKIDVAGTALDYCGYIGGTANDDGLGVTVDGAGNAYVTGATASAQDTFPVTVGPDLTLNGAADAFVAKILAIGPASAGALYFPHVATTFSWQTEIALINTGDQTVTGTLRALSNGGAPIDTVDVTLPAHGRRQITVAEEFTNHTNIGYVIFDSSSNDVQGYTKFYIEGRYRAAIPAVKEVNASDIYISHIASDTQWWTGLSLVNTTSSQKVLTITFNNGPIRIITLNANEHQAFSIRDLFDNQPQPGILSAVITNASGIIGLELFGGSNQLDGILLTDRTSSTLYYPHVAGGEWWTGIVAYNPSESDCNITITPYSGEGTPLTASTPPPIPGKGKYIGAVAALGLPAETAWFRIDSTQPLSGFELFGTVDGNQLAPYAERGGTGAKAGVFAKIEKNSGWTGIAFVNTEESVAAVTLTAYNDNGDVMATQGLPPVGGHAKVVTVAEDIFSQDISEATYIAYSSDRNVVGFQLNGTLDGMMLDGLPALSVP